MKPKVYLETTIVSYLAARPSRDLVTAAHQKITHDWWEHRRDKYDLFVSALVVDEASGGNPQAARRRGEFLQGLPLVKQTQGAVSLAGALLQRGPVPKEEPRDALHIALAAIHRMDILLTWNCAHIANVDIRFALSEICLSEGYRLPWLCTPEELMGDDYHVEG